MSTPEDILDDLKQQFDLAVRNNRKWFLRAMTHRSFANERELEYDNERLEFLGDAVLDLIICEYLFQEFPSAEEGKLSEIKSAVVNTRTLTRVARELELNDFLRLSKGEQRAERGRDKVVADSLEAFIGAIYVSSGLERTRSFILPYFEEEIDRYLEEGTRNYKGMDRVIRSTGWRTCPVLSTTPCTPFPC
ncbi:MAG: ribonuclease III [bacterium]